MTGSMMKRCSRALPPTRHCHLRKQNARRVLLVSDQVKVGRAALAQIRYIDEFDTFVTDRLASERLRGFCAESGAVVMRRGRIRGETD